MKRSLLFILAICIIAGNHLNGQGLLKKVAKSMTNELMGKPEEVDRGPEPTSACKDAKLVVDLGGKLQIDYTEVSISVRDDGAILMKYRITGEYYVAKDGVTQGPFKAGDKRLAGFEIADESFNPTSEEEDEKKQDEWITKYGQYISRKGEKYTITFEGKTYGPYAMINSFAVPRSKDKFAAIVIENMVVTASQGEDMEKAMKNAKTDQEKMDLAMKYTESMRQKMMEGGGPQSMMAKLVTNIPGANYDPAKSGGGVLSGTLKYDEILLSSYSGAIVDLKGNQVMTMKPEHAVSKNVFINSGNTKYAYEVYGELNFSDGSPKLNDLFNPHLVKEEGKVYLAYMYYSPKKNALMQCKIDF